MPWDYLLLKQLSNIVKNRGGYYKNFRDYLSPILDCSIDDSLKSKIYRLLDSDSVDTKQLDVILEELLSLFYSVIKNSLSLQDSLSKSFDKLSKTLVYLSEFGIESVEDLLYHFPYRYEVIDENSYEKSLLIGIYESSKIIKTKNGKRILEILFRGNNGYFYGVWFNFNNSYPLAILKKGEKYNLFGKVQVFNSLPSIIHPEIVDNRDIGKIRPVYLLPEKVKDNIFYGMLVKIFMKYSDILTETLPISLILKYGFMDIKNSLKYIHFPENPKDLEKNVKLASSRFVYEELFYLQIILLLRKKSFDAVRGIKFDVSMKLLETIKDFIPFKLTNAQRRVLKDIFRDMGSENQMNRLIQGDVGSGKTIVAFIAGVVAVKNGYQTAIIAPTEILAEQHYLNFNKLFGGHFSSALLTGSVKDKEKKQIKDMIKLGVINFIFGTHALIQEDVEFYKLGFVIIDEQHRFGVLQRKILIEKGYFPDILLMSATPIPRTLSLTLYGDLDVSVIDEMPPGRKPVLTKACRDYDRFKVFEFVKKEIDKGFGAYFVYPLIDESDSLELKAATKSYEEISKFFGEENVGLMHGKMKSVEKQSLMERFKKREIKVMVSTTVIEVGVDVPHATVMVIENAERFGLSQLHQLRGRVGRGGDRSYCFLIYSEKISDDGMKRIKAMVNYTDGFKLSEIDLEMRGPGDFLGTRQSGLPEFRFSNIVRDSLILIQAREDAKEIISNDPNLTLPENRIIRENLKIRWKETYDLINVG